MQVFFKPLLERGTNTKAIKCNVPGERLLIEFTLLVASNQSCKPKAPVFEELGMRLYSLLSFCRELHFVAVILLKVIP